MANIIKENTSLQKQAKAEAKTLVIYWVIALAAFLIPFIYKDKYSYIYLIPIFTLAIIIRISWKHFIVIRGNIGEKRVFKELRELPESYNVLNDVIIKVGDKEAQIDHLLVSPYGLWSIETKSHLGRIYGKEEDKNWTQKKRSDAGKIYTKTFYNPVKQNAVHCRRLQDFLKEKIGQEINTKSIVVFTSADELNTNTITPVVTLKDLNTTILASDINTTLDKDKVNKIIDLIMAS